MRARGSPRANTTLGPAACAPPLARGGCVVLIHLHKSAGTSLLRPLGVHGSALECSGGLYHCDAYLYTQTRCLMAVEKRPSLGGSGSWAATHPRLDYDNAYLYFGGYVQAMATAASHWRSWPPTPGFARCVVVVPRPSPLQEPDPPQSA